MCYLPALWVHQLVSATGTMSFLVPEFFFLPFSCHSHLGLKITTPKKCLLTFQDEVVSPLKSPQHIILYFKSYYLAYLAHINYIYPFSFFCPLLPLSLSLSSPSPTLSFPPQTNTPICYLFIFIHCFFFFVILACLPLLESMYHKSRGFSCLIQ